MKGQFTIEHANITPVEHMTGKSNSFGIFKHKVPPVYLLSNTTDEMHTWIKALESIVCFQKKIKKKERKKMIFNLTPLSKQSNPESVQSSGILDSIDGMVDPTVVANSRSKICGWNGAAEKMFGYTKSEAIGQDLSILMPPPYCDVHHNFVMNYKKTGQKKLIGLSRKLPAKRKDGTIISIELSLGEVPIAKGAILTEEQKQLAPRWVAVIREMNTTQASNAASVNSEEDSDGSSGSDDDAGDRSNLPEISQVKNTIVIPGISSSSSNNNNHVAVDANKSPSASLNKSPSTFSMNSAGDAKSPAVPSKDELSNQIEILRSENIRLMETLALIQKEKELLEIELKEYKNDEDSNLEKLLKDEFGYNAFLAYCMGERTEQNVMFWRFAEDYKHTLYVQDLKDKAEFIYETYIKEGAPYPLTMDSVRREFIKRAVQEPTRDTFASLQRHILSVSLMKNISKLCLTNKTNENRTWLKMRSLDSPRRKREESSSTSSSLDKKCKPHTPSI